MNTAMSGLLEPYGDLVKVLGYFQTKATVERMLKAFREVLQTSIENKNNLFSGNYPEPAMQKALDESKILLKNHYFKQV